jgi:hypothetical protein
MAVADAMHYSTGRMGNYPATSESLPENAVRLLDLHVAAPPAAVAGDGETLRLGGSGCVPGALPPPAAVADDGETSRLGGSGAGCPPPAAVADSDDGETLLRDGSPNLKWARLAARDLTS